MKQVCMLCGHGDRKISTKVLTKVYMVNKMSIKYIFTYCTSLQFHGWCWVWGNPLLPPLPDDIKLLSAYQSPSYLFPHCFIASYCAPSVKSNCPFMPPIFLISLITFYTQVYLRTNISQLPVGRAAHPLQLPQDHIPTLHVRKTYFTYSTVYCM